MARKYSSNYRPSVERECPVCGTMFRVEQSRIDAGRGKHCSRSCSFKSIPRRKALTAEERLSEKVDYSGGPDACWEWQGYTTGGYGRIFLNGREWPAHKVAWEVVNGPMPDGMQACHTCDNPPCCNPAHIFPGTPLENTQDAVKKGRHAYGERNGSAILTEEDVVLIRRRIANGETRAKIAREYGVTFATIDALHKGKTWRHVEAA